MSDLRMKASSGDGWDMAWDVDPPVWVVEIIALPSSPMRMEPVWVVEIIALPSFPMRMEPDEFLWMNSYGWVSADEFLWMNSYGWVSADEFLWMSFCRWNPCFFVFSICSDVRDPRAAPTHDLFLVRDIIRQLASDGQGVPDQATKDACDPIEATQSIPARVPFVSSSRLNSFGGPIQQSS
ncbi:hypothetical protein F2Q69_00049781 [Brassica cretica]|uniref:Uncharacterized protein n=1 Tax=Brassica cretica TaxID=69181 RepID=A0A8S9PXE5_BRACR|nr:hypothetical protein F2Q69_00049781 [Brassica cretica]